MSHKDSELPNSINSFAKIDINSGLDFPHLVCTAHFGVKNILKILVEVPNRLMTKNSKEVKQTLTDLSLAHVQTSYIKQVNFFLVCHIIN